MLLRLQSCQQTKTHKADARSIQASPYYYSLDGGGLLDDVDRVEPLPGALDDVDRVGVSLWEGGMTLTAPIVSLWDGLVVPLGGSCRS